MATTPLGWAPVSPNAEQDSLPGEPLTRTVAIVTDTVQSNSTHCRPMANHPFGWFCSCGPCFRESADWVTDDALAEPLNAGLASPCFRRLTESASFNKSESKIRLWMFPQP